MKLQQTLALPIGCIFLAIAIIMEKFLPSKEWSDFLEGMFMGLSLVLNLYYLVVVLRKKKR